MRPEAQADFAAALFGPDASVPSGLIATPRRLAVHRDTVAATLTSVVEARYPVVRRLVGDAFFAAMARFFVVAHPPESPALVFYGAVFPAFLDAFEPARALPYLADVARLEWARHEAFHGTNAACADASLLASIPPEALAEVHLILHPTVRLVASDYPILAIWRANAEADGRCEIEDRPETALVVRPEFSVRTLPFPRGGEPLVRRLMEGAPLGAAAVGVPCVSETLAALVHARALSAIISCP